MYKITLADGTIIEFADLNGTNFVTQNQTEIDTSIFTDENLVSGTITKDDGSIEEFRNWSFIQQQKQLTGEYYICFRQKTEAELEAELQEARETELQEALVELYEMMLGGAE